ncbi:MAG: ABC transporter ATP-binding protein [Lachnospiraceae bacterium]|jgi:ABC-2 type transport system ATP-binding protein|nr:ABC transporter ATP-binding protein [Lachnospiraceae bacterium]
MNNAITVENVSLRFAEKTILNQVTFHVQEGEIFGLLGPSGAGKTTLIKILTGQHRQDSGYAELLKKDTRKLGVREHEQIGTMMDSLGLYDRLSAYDNLLFYAEICHVGRSRITDLLKSIGLYESRRVAVSKLSKGMKNRLSLARALLNDAKILFLDEPACGLDPATTQEIHRVLRRQREKGKTIFLTTHNMFEAQSLCDHVALLSKGSIIEYGKPADICKKYNHTDELRMTLKDGKTLSLKNGSASALLMKELLEKEAIQTIHSTEPTLEDVFIELTGRGLD